ncbi:hypothetical protein BS50DRAFT_676739 [Corynespora cassiicola Philippines]|uniref:Uncharacterized protein n=1 Tax=Corynespora cassiicola Philippines TaxID=1448308 RepID=A0A2T2NPC6_CORCC|nr:hypothetical protein BS50DRAFT_676739 [Corynespora cassiicola Philippines]
MRKLFFPFSYVVRLSMKDHGDDKGRQDGLPEKVKVKEIGWHQPAIMTFFLGLGVMTAVAHHLYFFSLHHRKVYTGMWQQWPIRFGSGLSFLTISLFNMAIGSAYSQYMWKKIRNKHFSLSDVDGLFSLTTNATGLFQGGIIRGAHTVAIIAFIGWLLPIATVIPPATLTVSNMIVPFVTQLSVPTLQTNVNYWTQNMQEKHHHDQDGSNWTPLWEPTSYVRQAIAQAAMENIIRGFLPMSLNMSYTIMFPGPSLQCGTASVTQKLLFDNYMRNQSYVTSLTNRDKQMSSPLESSTKTMKLLVYKFLRPDNAPENSLSPVMDNSVALTATNEPGMQFWIRTPEQYIVCLQGFSHFSVLFKWINGMPNHEVTRINFTSNTSDEIGWKHRVSSAVFESLSEVVNDSLAILEDQHMKLETKGNFMLTGLRGCDEIVNNYWIKIGKLPRVPEAVHGNDEFGMTASFPPEPFSCRNKTLAAAFEDLSNNITVNLVGLDLTSQNNTLAEVLFEPSEILYVYEPRNLIITYVCTGLVSLIAVMFGIAALHENGVAHSLKFSAIMDATRSPELATITGDCGLGMPIDKTAGQTKLRFGLLEGVKEGDSHKVGFVLAEEE